MNDPNLHRKLGPYQLLETVGRGGMGTVYRAEEESTHEIAAVKLLSPILATDPSFRERFTSEIESLKKLRHDNIVQLFGYGEQDGQLFYSMELIDGRSLQDELRQGRRFDWREVTRIAIDICAALKHAHDHGIIHRDLKPANLLYTTNETVKLLDFGIAKLFGATGVTTGSVMGTADYMAPEQAEGKAVGPRTDLYSLGSVMYALLSGRPPFVGKSVPEVVHKVRFESPIPVSRLALDVPEELEDIIEQLLEKNPQHRIPTALALSHRLKAMEHALTVKPQTDELPHKLETSVVRFETGEMEDPSTRNQTVKLDTSNLEHSEIDKLTVTTSDTDVEHGPDRFVVVENKPRRVDESNTMLRVVGQTIAALAVIGALAYSVVQIVKQSARPASADELYQSIVEASEKGGWSQLLTVESEIDEFLHSYNDDPRIEQVREFDEEVELARRQRQLEARARLRRADSESALEQLYLEIIRQSRTDPRGAMTRLEALVQLYADAPPNDEDQQQILDLAQRQIERAAQADQDQAEQQRPLIEDRLAAARQFAADGQAGKAHGLLQGLIELYHDEPWADEAMQVARELLAQLTDQ